MGLRLLSMSLAALSVLFAQTFEEVRIYARQEHKLKLMRISLEVRDDALVVTVKSKGATSVRIPFAHITEIEYEKSRRRRLKTGLLLPPSDPQSKGDKHWLGVIQGEHETVFQLDNRNFLEILAAIESKTGKKVKSVRKPSVKTGFFCPVDGGYTQDKVASSRPSIVAASLRPRRGPSARRRAQAEFHRHSHR